MPRATPATPSILGLRQIRFLGELPAGALEQLGRDCRWRRYLPSQQVISRDAPERDVYLIVTGLVRATAFSAAGRQVTYRDIPAGDWFGDFSAIDGYARSADVVAVRETLVAIMSPLVFRRLIHDHPAVCDHMLLRLVTSMRELTERVFEYSTLGVQNRVHAELLRLARQSGISKNHARIEPAPKHADIAAQVSTYREQVTREISRMVKQGLIARAGGALVVQDVARLEGLVAAVRRSA
jgi:CRP/FNR family cyclic AMP-dependent transcriptional regulator